MTTVYPESEDFDPLLVEAADWFVRLTSGEATEADARALKQWRAVDPRHEAAFEQISALYEAHFAIGRKRRASRRRDVLLGAVGVTVTGAGAYGVARPPLGLWPSWAELTADYRTAAGQRRALSPTPGVLVDMNSGTSLSMADAGAGVRLVHGEAFVAVNAPKRPFAVETEAGRVDARAAKFNVRFLAGALNVACVEGLLTCRHAGRQVPLREGEALAIARNGAVTRTQINPALAASWMNGLLVFRGEALVNVVAQLNLYRPGRIIITNPDVGRRSVVGNFHTDQVDNALVDIQQLLGVNLRRLPGGMVFIG
jgi:transmembrane sensor